MRNPCSCQEVCLIWINYSTIPCFVYLSNLIILFTGFTGTQCEIDIDECKDQPCLNGGVCQDRINSFKCSCAIGFTGSRCQINIDDCVSSPCRNGGTCHDSIAGYTCECPPGFTGKLF